MCNEEDNQRHVCKMVKAVGSDLIQYAEGEARDCAELADAIARQQSKKQQEGSYPAAPPANPPDLSSGWHIHLTPEFRGSYSCSPP